MSHRYIVVTPPVPQWLSHGELGNEPLGDIPYTVEVKADSKREAITKAMRSPEFRDWVRDQRGDGRNPFAGVKAEPMHCAHGVCMCHDAEPYINGSCDECRAFHAFVDSLLEVAYAEPDGGREREREIVEWANSVSVLRWRERRHEVEQVAHAS